MKMPGQSGSEIRIRNHVVNSRWDDDELAMLEQLAAATGAGKAETLRQLVRRADRELPTVRATTNTLVRIGNLLARIAQRASATGDISQRELLQTKHALELLVRDLRR
jgi:hypothetical protein